MATSLDTIRQFLTELEIRHKFQKDALFGVMRTVNYRNIRGEGFVWFAIQLTEKGEFLRIAAPFAFECNPANKAALFETAMIANLRHKLIKVGYDPADGEVCLEIEVALEDASLTRQQLARMLHALGYFVDTLWTHFTSANERGVVTIADELVTARALRVRKPAAATRMGKARKEREPVPAG